VRHAVTGRLRVALPAGGRNRQTVACVARRLSGEPGVTRVSANGLCASITLEYDPDRVGQDALLGVLERLTMSDLAAFREPQAVLGPRKIGPAGDGSDKAPRQGTGRHRLLWTIGGTFFVGMSMMGVIMPGLPTAPFVLLAAYCYLRGSRKLYHWLLNHRLFGKFVEETETGVRISRKAKKVTAYLLWVSIAISCTFFIQAWPLRGVMILTGAVVSWFLLRGNPQELPDDENEQAA